MANKIPLAPWITRLEDLFADDVDIAITTEPDGTIVVGAVHDGVEYAFHVVEIRNVD